jgi:hypothetical protein
MSDKLACSKSVEIHPAGNRDAVFIGCVPQNFPTLLNRIQNQSWLDVLNWKKQHLQKKRLRAIFFESDCVC